MAKIDLTPKELGTCLTAAEIIKNGGNIILNPDGTVSVYHDSQYGPFPAQITAQCCSVIDPSYYFDINTQECRYSQPKTCSFSPEEPINLLINPVADDGALFFIDSFESETCTLKIDFDYLLKIKCEDLMNVSNPVLTLDTHTNAVSQNIIKVQSEISDVNVKIESIQSEAVLLNDMINNTSYSIHCDTFPIILVGPLAETTAAKAASAIPSATTESLSNFDNSAFSKKSSNSVTSKQKPAPITRQATFCLTDPYGLQIWSQILGPIRYQAFLNGDPTSYTCADVIQIATTTYPNGPVVNECDTPFGTKTQLINQLSGVMLDLSNTSNLLTTLETELATLESTFATLSVSNTACKTPVDALETFDVWMTLDIVNPDNSLTLVYETQLLNIGNGNLYNYITSNPNTGLFVCGAPTCTPLTMPTQGDNTPNVYPCDSLVKTLINDLYPESQMTDFQSYVETLPTSAFHSEWLTYSHVVTEPNLINMITNKKIKISIKIKNACIDFCMLLDNIHMDKTCTVVDRNDITISKNPSFEISRVIDNKKSWIDTNELTHRQFLIAKSDDTNPIRQTDYNVNDDRLILNSKELDLDICVASAIENDVWFYLNNNPCLLTGNTLNDCTPCNIYQVSLDNLLTTSLSGITTIEGFENLITSELIDAKNRQTITSYATLRALYDRYINSSAYCGTISSGYNYQNIDDFAGLVGNFWVDLIEQVIPSTTIWGSVKIYTNTIFDEQKFKYKAYSSLFCNNPFFGEHVLSPINGTSGETANVSVTYTSLIDHNGPTTKFTQIPPVTCGTVNIAQMNSGSEFIGSVDITPKPKPIIPQVGCDANTNVISDCSMGIDSINISNVSNGYLLKPIITNGVAPFTYLWSDGSTNSTLTVTNPGTYTVVIKDANCCQARARKEVLPVTACWYTLPERPEYLMAEFFGNIGYVCYPHQVNQASSDTFMIDSLVVNGTERLLSGVNYSTDISPANVNWVPANNLVVSGCTLGNPTGFTYTNWVDYLNLTFDSLGLEQFRAQVSLKSQKLGSPIFDDHNGFYIIRPIGETFSMKTETTHNFDKYIYTDTGLQPWIPNDSWMGNGYFKSFCTGITITNNYKVTE
jgi:hypothetical protein